MKAFDDLNRPAQFRRLTRLARRAVAEYEIEDCLLSPLQLVQNATWRVRCGRTRQQYLLRVHAPRRHDTAAICSELLWLDFLAAEDDLLVPTAITSRRGQLWTEVGTDEIPERRLCTLLTWIPGRTQRRRRTPALLRRIGRLMARLHRSAIHFNVPGSFVRPRWDHHGLFQNDDTQRGWRGLTRRQRMLFQAVAERTAKVMERLGAGRDVFGLIHSDLVFSNIVFHRGLPQPIDFDDCGFGYFLYDIAVLLDRIEMRDDYALLRAALLDGYREVHPLAAEHDGYLDLFLLARWVFLGTCFLSRPEFRDYAPRFMAIVEPKIERYLSFVPSE